MDRRNPALLIFALLAIAAAPRPAVTAGAHAAHLARMGVAEERRLDLFDALESGKHAPVAGIATALLPVLAEEHAYWLASGDAVAIDLSQRNLDALAVLETAATGGDPKAVESAVQALSASCAACHDAHPERRVAVRK